MTAGSIVCQFTLFPSSNSMWYHSQLAFLTACSNFITIYPNLFQFWKERMWEWLGTYILENDYDD